jgi:uncharacterized membrane protein YjdF
VTTASEQTQQTEPGHRDLATRVHRWVVVVLAVIMGADLVLILLEAQWLNAFLIGTIMCVLLAPVLLRQRLPVQVPAELQLFALAFMFAALFLGEIRNYYDRIWWWDIALHASSGLLLGVFGFLLIYVLNESRNIDVYMRPRFVALFAFLFAVAIGAIWEIFEYAMDSIFGLTMQKPMWGDPSGLTDTMWDLIVDTIGALTISALGWWYMHRGARSFIEVWIQKFIARNPHLFPN